MRHFGLVCPPVTGHMHPMLALGREMARRGHRVTVLSHPMAQSATERAGLEFQSIGAAESPPGALEKALELYAGSTGRAALEHLMSMGVLATASYLRELPDLIRDHSVDALLIDEMCLTAGAVADAAAIPFIGICNALPVDADSRFPPCLLHWTYRPGWLSRLRNLSGYLRIAWQARRGGLQIARMLHRAGMRKSWRSDALQSRLATIAQIPAEFDFPCPRRRTFHYVGPMFDPEVRGHTAFPWERLDGRPLVYASMGTLLNHPAIFRSVAAACDGMDVQLVMTLGRMNPEAVGPLSGNPLVVPYAPQRELLERAALAIVHAGLNTAMDALAYGVPLVAIPVGSDQPGVAARVEWHGAGERILPEELSVERLRAAAHRVLAGPSYREQAQRLGRAIQSSGGARKAADIVESVGSGSLCRRSGNPAPRAARG